MSVGSIATALRGSRFRFASEEQLQDGIAVALARAGIPFERERRLSAADRVDFLVPDGIAIEVKIAGGATAVVRQLQRYAEHDDVRAVVLATTRRQHGAIPDQLLGKPVHVVHLNGADL